MDTSVKPRSEAKLSSLAQRIWQGEHLIISFTYIQDTYFYIHLTAEYKCTILFLKNNYEVKPLPTYKK
jgi:hypothetical protein